MCHFARWVRLLDYVQLKATARHQLMQKVKAKSRHPFLVARRQAEAVSLLQRYWLAIRLCEGM